MKRLICISTAAILLAAAPAIALTGNFLKLYADMSEKYPGSQYDAFFLGYVMGVHERTTANTCVPSGVNNGQVAEVVRKYLQDHPEKLHLVPSDLVINAIQTAWPCEEQKPSNTTFR